MDNVSEIKQKLNIVDVISQYIELKKSGRNYKGLCPFHAEKTPSFMVSGELQIYKCFGCGESGDMFSFVQKIEGVDFSKSLEILAEKAGIELKKEGLDPNKSKKAIIYEINYLASQYFHYILTNHKAGEEALKYLKEKRKLKDSTIKEFNLGYAPNSWNSLYEFLTKKKFSMNDLLLADVINRKRSGEGFIDKFRARVIFPLIGVSDKVEGFMGRTIKDEMPKYLNTSETLIFHKGSYLYGLNKSKIEIKQGGALFVEGPIDVLTAWQLGVKNVVASSGTALTKEHLKLISRYTNEITFCFDADFAGREAITRAIALAEKDNFDIRVAIIPDPYKDLDEFAVKKPSEIKEFVSSPVPVFEFLLISALKKFNRNDPIGKNNIVKYLIPFYSPIKNPITLDHYVSKLSEAIKIDKNTLFDIFRTKSLKDLPTRSFQSPVSKSSLSSGRNSEAGAKPPPHSPLPKSPEAVFLALCMKAPIDTASPFMYKIARGDFTNSELGQIFSALKTRLVSEKKPFDIRDFSIKLNDELKNLVSEMYLWDLSGVDEDAYTLSKELERTFYRIKSESIKRELKEISEKIKEAEIQKDQDALRKLSEKFSSLTSKLANL